MSLREDLIARWPLAGDKGPGARDELRDQLLDAWDRPGYHDLLHLTEVLDRLDALAAGGAAFHPTRLALAAWFHDAVYAGTDHDEEDSARWAERALPDPPAAEVARLVRLTAHHRPADDDPDGAALSDADLGILAAGPERYAAYVAGVRADYAHLSDEEFRAGRAAALADLATKGTLFHTAQARAAWEAPARANLERELADLRRRGRGETS